MAFRAGTYFSKTIVGQDTLQLILVKRPVRTRMQGVVGAGGEKPPATRLGACFNDILHFSIKILQVFFSESAISLAQIAIFL